MPRVFVIGGPNGAGKTTAALTLLPAIVNCEEYLNADTIAAALSPFHPETVAIQAGRLLLQRIHTLAEQKQDFAFETTLASKSFAPFLQKCKDKGYTISLLYLWLESPKLAVERVANRVKSGGHDIPVDVIYRRYQRSMQNFMQMYLPIVDDWGLYDNSLEQLFLVAKKELNQTIQIYDKSVWQMFQEMT